jgi:endonuclease YncB( thermonuclease family)
MNFFCCFFNNKNYNDDQKNDDQKNDDQKRNNKEDKEINKYFEKFSKITDPKEIPYFSFSGMTFIAKHCNIYDGDTFSAIFEYKGEIIKYRIRSKGYDCAEMKPRKNIENRDLQIELAHKAKNRFEELLNKHPTKLIKIECFEFDKYGRLLANIYNFVDTNSINDIMIEEGHGKVYNGGTKEEW